MTNAQVINKSNLQQHGKGKGLHDPDKLGQGAMVGRGSGGSDGVRHGGSDIRFNRNICMTLNKKVMENAIIRQCAQAIHKAMMKAIGDDAQVAVAKVRTNAGLIEITAWEDERLEVLVAHDNRNETECINLCKAIENECVFWAIAKDEYYTLHSGAWA